MVVADLVFSRHKLGFRRVIQSVSLFGNTVLEAPWTPVKLKLPPSTLSSSFSRFPITRIFRAWSFLSCITHPLFAIDNFPHKETVSSSRARLLSSCPYAFTRLRVLCVRGPPASMPQACNSYT